MAGLQGTLIHHLELQPDSPAEQGVEVPFLRVKGLVFCTSQSKADGQNREGEDEETCNPKYSSPSIKPDHGGQGNDVSL